MLTDDPIYHACIAEALKSPCQKKGVGAAFVGPQGHIIAQEHNLPIEGMEGMCQPTCIRFQIQSRTESMLGACGHAEERLIAKVVKMGYQPFFADFSIYVAAVTADKAPEQRPFPEFTCLRCAVQMHLYEIASVHVAYLGQSWVKQTTAQALASAQEYARGEKKV